MSHIEFVNIEEAENILKRMAERTEAPEVQPLLREVEVEMKQFIYGLILTAIHTGLILDTPERLEELRMKLVVAMDSGFVLGLEKAGSQ